MNRPQALAQLRTALAKKNNARSPRERIEAHREAKFWADQVKHGIRELSPAELESVRVA